MTTNGLLDLGILLVALVVILVGAELFTNGIEWFGHKLDLAEGAVGSVLAAVGTALPETMIPTVAILFGGGAAADEIGVGAVLGAPFMLATLAMFVTGLAVVLVGRKRPTGDRMTVAQDVLGHDLRVFAVAYAVAIGSALIPSELFPVRLVVAALLLGIYGWYVKEHLEAEERIEGEALAPLRLHRLDRRGHRRNPRVPRLRIVTLQVAVAIGCIVGGAVLFVDAVEGIARAVAVPEAILALVVAPVATELPEKFNSVLWIRAGKDTLALGNITGAMVFQATIPTVIAIVFASSTWALSEESSLAFASAGMAFLSSWLIFGAFRRAHLHGRRLLVGGLVYAAYLAIVVAVLGGG
ncbi:MAG TPA: sodium:calcium antiporter [Candidatus Binatia bacterium]|nr:sodium:calcium antiporter [Candidatus Binatia bacterium]